MSNALRTADNVRDRALIVSSKEDGSVTAGDASAFEQAVRAYTRELRRYALGLCRDRWLAEDIVQDALVRAWRARSTVRDAGAIRAWLYAIVRREFLRRMAEAPAHTVAAEGGIDELAIETDHELRLDLAAALEGLEEESRIILLSQVLGGYSGAEIAAALNLSESAVMTRLTRLRRLLRTLMARRG